MSYIITTCVICIACLVPAANARELQRVSGRQGSIARFDLLLRNENVLMLRLCSPQKQAQNGTWIERCRINSRPPELRWDRSKGCLAARVVGFLSFPK